MKKSDRYLGCLLGLATGDAVGTTLQFRSPGTFEPVDDMLGGGPFDLNPCEWTDDTSMALCLAASLVEGSKFDPVDQLERYCRWQKDGYMSSNGTCFDIGNTVRRALEGYRVNGRPDSGPKDPHSAGNGSIMRLAPVPMFFGTDAAMAVDHCGKSSMTTHGAVACVDACRYFGGLLWGALNGVSKDALLEPLYSPVPDLQETFPLCPEIAEVARGSFRQKHPPDIRGTGYVVESLEAALWAFLTTENFRDGCLAAVNLGDDADTTGAIYGQLAGAYYEASSIPAPWVERLARKSLLMEMAEKLMRAAGDDKAAPTGVEP